MQKPVYLDNASTTPMDPSVFEAMRPWFMECFGNAASGTHLYGWEARDAVEEARGQVAALIGAGANEVVFTGGATESVNLALKGIAERHGFKGVHIVTCVTEHRAVLDVCAHLESMGCEITRLEVDGMGCIDLGALEAAMRPETRLVALMFANNETGVLHPMQEVSEITGRHGVPLFCDATQAVGKVEVDVSRQGIDLMAFSAHKFHGPKGVGALFVRKGADHNKPVAQMDGGRHERGYRSGTLNVPGIVGMGAAARLCRRLMAVERERILGLRDLLERRLLGIPGSRLNGHPTRRLHNVSNLCFEGVEGKSIAISLSRELAVSNGSACSSLVQEPSHVLRAMGLEDGQARASFRFSMGRYTTAAEVETAVRLMEERLLGYRR